jgi:iron complex transport system substrate-binding protein
MAYTANVSVKKAQEMRRLKIPIVLNYDFEEKHPLARAEWIIFESAFFGKDKEAQELFGQIKTNYNELKRRATKFKVKKILVGDIQNGRWATCGEKSDLGILIKDAGGELVFKNETSQTQFMSLEKALKEKIVPDLWLAQNTWEKKESALKDSRYKKFSSLPIFNNTKRLNANGFSDFWETGIARPDLLLKDLLLIFHPQEVSVEETIWYKELK